MLPFLLFLAACLVETVAQLDGSIFATSLMCPAQGQEREKVPVKFLPPNIHQELP